MPISYDDAYAQTNPAAPDNQRDQSAKAIIAGTAAAEAYWGSRGTLEALQAQADGHGIVVRNTEGESTPAPSIEGTAVEEPAQVEQAPASTEDTVAALRKQLQENNLTPAA